MALRAGQGWRPGSPLRARHVGPILESLPHLVTVHRRRQQMPSGSEVLGNRSIGRQKTLGMAGGLEPLHATLPLARRSCVSSHSGC